MLMVFTSYIKITAGVDYWYKLNGATPEAPVSPVAVIVTSLISAVPDASNRKIVQSS